MFITSHFMAFFGAGAAFIVLACACSLPLTSWPSSGLALPSSSWHVHVHYLSLHGLLRGWRCLHRLGMCMFITSHFMAFFGAGAAFIVLACACSLPLTSWP